MTESLFRSSVKIKSEVAISVGRDCVKIVFGESVMQEEKSSSFLSLYVSRCLLGEACRYDGKSKKVDLPDFGPYVRIVSACPEVVAGFGTPRPPIEIVKTDPAGESTPEIWRRESRADVTPALRLACRRILEGFGEKPPVAFLLKARSPSCGRESPLHDAIGAEIGMAPGELVRQIRIRYPDIPIFTEEEIPKLQVWVRERLFSK